MALSPFGQNRIVWNYRVVELETHRHGDARMRRIPKHLTGLNVGLADAILAANERYCELIGRPTNVPAMLQRYTPARSARPTDERLAAARVYGQER